MAIQTIRIWPDPVLTRKTRNVGQVDGTTRTLITDMFDTMYDASGIGLAANQIGVAQQVLVIDLDSAQQAKKDPALQEELTSWLYRGPVSLVNPVIKFREGKITWEEGCLSLPGVTDSVTRSAHVVVDSLDQDGNPQTIEAKGLYAVCIQHEMDHLDGKVFVDYLSKLKRDVIRRKMQKLREEQHPPNERGTIEGA